MSEEWLLDGRQIPDEVMGYIRKMAVHAIRERGESPELIAQIFNFNRSCIYRWLKQYDEGIRANLRQALEKQSERPHVFPRSTERERTERWCCPPSP